MALVSSRDSIASIAASYKACIECFNQLCSIGETTKGTHAQDLRDTGMSDELARFRIWAANCGAHHPARFRYSLDYRLRGSRHARKMILEGLERLELFLRQGEWSYS